MGKYQEIIEGIKEDMKNEDIPQCAYWAFYSGRLQAELVLAFRKIEYMETFIKKSVEKGWANV